MWGERGRLAGPPTLDPQAVPLGLLCMKRPLRWCSAVSRRPCVKPRYNRRLVKIPGAVSLEPLPSPTSHSRQNWRPDGTQAMSRNHPHRYVAQRLGCYHGRGEQSCPVGQDDHPTLQISPERNYGMLQLVESHQASAGRGCVLTQGTTRPSGMASPVVLSVSEWPGPSRVGRTQRMLVPGDVAASRGGAADGSSGSVCALPVRRPVDGAPHGQGRPLGSLDAHKARRLAQGFDENSVEVMLQARKGSTNTTYDMY